MMMTYDEQRDQTAREHADACRRGVELLVRDGSGGLVPAPEGAALAEIAVARWAHGGFVCEARQDDDPAGEWTCSATPPPAHPWRAASGEAASALGLDVGADGSLVPVWTSPTGDRGPERFTRISYAIAAASTVASSIDEAAERSLRTPAPGSDPSVAESIERLLRSFKKLPLGLVDPSERLGWPVVHSEAIRCIPPMTFDSPRQSRLWQETMLAERRAQDHLVLFHHVDAPLALPAGRRLPMRIYIAKSRHTLSVNSLDLVFGPGRGPEWMVEPRRLDLNSTLAPLKHEARRREEELGRNRSREVRRLDDQLERRARRAVRALGWDGPVSVRTIPSVWPTGWRCEIRGPVSAADQGPFPIWGRADSCDVARAEAAKAFAAWLGTCRSPDDGMQVDEALCAFGPIDASRRLGR